MGCLGLQAKLVPPDYWLTAQVLAFPGKVVTSQTVHTYKHVWLCWMVIFQALVECLDILILVKSPIKWRQCPEVTLAVDWDVKHQFKQTNKQTLSRCYRRAANVKRASHTRLGHVTEQIFVKNMRQTRSKRIQRACNARGTYSKRI